MDSTFLYAFYVRSILDMELDELFDLVDIVFRQRMLPAKRFGSLPGVGYSSLACA
jgi:hypothetical protein